MTKRAIIAAAAAAVLGCSSGNPYDTSWEESRLVELEERLLTAERALIVPPPEPPDETLGTLRPNLDDWKATVLEKADSRTAARMEEDSRARVALTKQLLADFNARSYRVYHAPVLELQQALALEEAKLRLITAHRGR